MAQDTRAWRLLGATLLFVLWPAAAVPDTGPAPADFPKAFYLQAAEKARPVYRVESRESSVRVHVRRGGLLGAFGHNHVVTAGTVRGYALVEEDNSGRADLYLYVQDLQVDEPEARQAAGLEADALSAQDIRKTRRNMLSEVLHAERYPLMRAHVELSPEDAARVSLTLHGNKQRLSVPVTIERDRGSIRATGRFSITHTQFGMQPYAAVGGTLRVRDGLEIEFDIKALPLPPADR